MASTLLVAKQGTEEKTNATCSYSNEQVAFLFEAKICKKLFAPVYYP